MSKQAVQRAIYWIHEQMLTTAGKCFCTYGLNYVSESKLFTADNKLNLQKGTYFYNDQCLANRELEADARPLKPEPYNKVLVTNIEGKTSTTIFEINSISKGPTSTAGTSRF